MIDYEDVAYEDSVSVYWHEDTTDIYGGEDRYLDSAYEDRTDIGE